MALSSAVKHAWRCATAVLMFAAPPLLAQDRAAEIVSLEGSGEFREAQQPAWRTAKVQQPLFPTNFVRTGDLSRMALLFGDRTQLRLAPNSVLQIKEASKGPDAKTIINLNSGRSWVQSKAAPKNLTMQTPSALAAIRGTDWEMVVEADGRSTLSVFSGEVQLSNPQGAVTVQRGEQARAEVGKAPVKLQVTVSRDRIQWVSSVTVDPERYKGTPGADLLLRSDQQAFNGDLAAAAATLEAGRAQFPGDDRFSAGLSRLALLAGDSARALALARDAATSRPASIEAWLAAGDAARLEGLGEESALAYQRAIDLAAGDARGWHGLGVVEGERDNLRRARELLAKALQLRETAGSAAELGTVTTLASRNAEARAAFERALALQPDHYVAWTGLGILHLRSGDLDAATEALLKASLVEPRDSRAHVYLAAAYYQAGRYDAATAEVLRAAETDPKDSLPRLLASLMRLDAIDPVAAAAEAREALARLPFLKSLNAIADNQKGIANFGAPLAFMGLESWARSAAQDSYRADWGASHLFLSDRYPGAFSRRSELMLGFSTDPLAFGASNRFQALVPVPGHHATASLRYARSDDVSNTEPVLAANGLVTGDVPFAYFVEGIGTNIDPRNSAFEARGKTLTAALGVRPVHELSIFLYGSRFSADVDSGRAGETGVFSRLDGSVERLDLGARYAVSADQSLWVKVGAGREDSHNAQVSSVLLPQQTLESRLDFQLRPEGRDAGVRHAMRTGSQLEWTVGAEAARVKTPSVLVRDAQLHLAGTPVAQETLELTDEDRSRQAYALARVGRDALVAELGVGWHDYRKERSARLTGPPGVLEDADAFHRSGADPMAGVVWRPAAGHTGRAACRKWSRPASPDTMLPIAIAGIPVEDQLVFPGGDLRQCRAQWEWTVSSASFVEVHYQDARANNLATPVAVLNTRTDVTNHDRLLNRVLAPPGRPDELEDVPVFSEGTARTFHAAYERTLGRSLAFRAHYAYTDSENTDPLFETRNKIPYLPRHRADLGVSWSPGWGTLLRVAGTWRSVRYRDETNVDPLPQGWDARVNLFVESRDKRWALEAFGYNLLKKEASDVFGVVGSWRF